MKIQSQLIVISVLRTILNTMHRMVYPFLTVFAQGLGVDVTQISFALTGRNVVAIFGPMLATVSDVRGRKFGMLLGVGLFATGTSLMALWPGLLTFGAALILAMLGIALFNPAIYAYLGDQVAYEQRGRASAITEIAWSAAFIAGVPAMGWLIAHLGWQSPFKVLAALGFVMLAVLWRMIPRDAGGNKAASPLRHVPTVMRSIPALAGVSVAMWASAANEMITLNFGVWLANSFQLRIEALAGASAVIGLSELTGESLVATVTDRIGKPLAVAIGICVNILASAMLPWIGRTELGALAGLFLFYLSFEYLIVSQMPMMTEVLPGARATTMALNFMGNGAGRSLGALLSTLMYAKLGFGAVTAVALLFDILSLLALAEMQQKLVIMPRILGWLRRTTRSR